MTTSVCEEPGIDAVSTLTLIGVGNLALMQGLSRPFHSLAYRFLLILWRGNRDQRYEGSEVIGMIRPGRVELERSTGVKYSRRASMLESWRPGTPAGIPSCSCDVIASSVLSE